MTQPLHNTVVQPGYPAHRRIVEAFGTEVLLENGDIDRKVLGDLIFNQPDRRQLLNSITHPEIRKEMMKETFKYFLRGETRQPPDRAGPFSVRSWARLGSWLIRRLSGLAPPVSHSAESMRMWLVVFNQCLV